MSLSPRPLRLMTIVAPSSSVGHKSCRPSTTKSECHLIVSQDMTACCQLCGILLWLEAHQSSCWPLDPSTICQDRLTYVGLTSSTIHEHAICCEILPRSCLAQPVLKIFIQRAIVLYGGCWQSRRACTILGRPCQDACKRVSPMQNLWTSRSCSI